MAATFPLLREAFGRIAWALTRSRWASDLISDARMARRFATFKSAHLKAGRTVITTERNGLVVVSLEG